LRQPYLTGGATIPLHPSPEGIQGGFNRQVVFLSGLKTLSFPLTEYFL